MSISTLTLYAAVLGCALTTGLVFAFAVVVMPAIRTLPDRDFLTAFKAMDRIIQDNDPRFLLVWAGSIVLVLAAGALHVPSLAGWPRWLLIGAVACYLFGVQGPTFAVNVPLNNRLQATDLSALDDAGVRAARMAFERPWIYWNAFRTVFGLISTVLLLAVTALA